ncbi:hypothetical protein DL96DRAFT_1566462 [Flagelloscypha sp. PMI_526]|nr:hypothetical protein DL96DRAFT_1566462 [Flagelloscypha sp. PMI_526]
MQYPKKSLVRFLPGLEEPEIVPPTREAEYGSVDSCPFPSILEAKHIPYLYLARQIDRTAEYEEATAQGLAGRRGISGIVLGGVGSVLKRRREREVNNAIQLWVTYPPWTVLFHLMLL